MTVNKTRYQKDLEDRQSQMRKRILKAAMELFLKKGFENVTIRKIASKIEYSIGTIYRYFPDKDEIFFDLRGEGFKKFYKTQIDARKSTDPKTRLKEHAQAYVKFALENPEYYELMFLIKAPIERASEKKEWATTAQSLELLREDTLMAIDAGLLVSDNVDSAVFSLWSLLHGTIALILRRRFLLHTNTSDIELSNQVVKFLFQNILNNKERR